MRRARRECCIAAVFLTFCTQLMSLFIDHNVAFVTHFFKALVDVGGKKVRNVAVRIICAQSYMQRERIFQNIEEECVTGRNE